LFAAGSHCWQWGVILNIMKDPPALKGTLKQKINLACGALLNRKILKVSKMGLSKVSFFYLPLSLTNSGESIFDILKTNNFTKTWRNSKLLLDIQEQGKSFHEKNESQKISLDCSLKQLSITNLLQ
jgi:hypothetical protein